MAVNNFLLNLYAHKTHQDIYELISVLPFSL